MADDRLRCGQLLFLHPAEHWRIAFRRHYFTRARALPRALDAYLRFYNVNRPHPGDRLNGLTPATKFAGAVAA